MLKQILLVTLVVLALRLPFLNQAIQGDDVYYLYGAEHAQVDPLHPNHVRYAFLAQMVDMRGHPHPPFNGWYLGGVLALRGSVREIPFHVAFLPFSLVAAWSALWLARRFSSRPLMATLLFLVTPTFVVNGTSLETDLPFVSFWLATCALFVGAVDRRWVAGLVGSVVCMILAIFTAYQAVVLVPILGVYGRKWRASWIALLFAPAAIAAWQIYERSTSGALPATVLANYLQSYGLQALTQKVRNAVALTAHLGWIVFPPAAVVALRLRRWEYALPSIAMIAAAVVNINPLFWASIGAGVVILVWCVAHWRDFLAQWILIFFAAALVIFFAGSARYLLPAVLPVAISVSNRVGQKWLAPAIALEGVLSILLAIVNYQVWDGYREFAQGLRHEAETSRVWVNAEWGLRFYLEDEGALPLLRGVPVHPGEMVVSSGFASAANISVAGGGLSTVSEREITSPIPLRLFALHGRSAYSTTQFGLQPFDISTEPVDIVRAQIAVEKKPELERLLMNTEAARDQIVSGIYGIENGRYRWMADKAVVILKSPKNPEPLSIQLFIPAQAPARKITVSADNQQVANQVYPGAGSYTLTTPPLRPQGPAVTVTIQVDKTFSVPGDQRQLGVVLSEIGFTP